MSNRYFTSRVVIGVFLMTISFFLTLGLLQRFDLSYLYPFQGLSVVCVFGSELLLKRGATQVAAPDDAFSWSGINGLASPLVWWAIVLIIASFISWLYVLRYIPLSFAYPLSRVVDILVPLGCWIFLGELISTLRWCGIALVIIGLALVAKPIAKMEERL